MRIAVISDIHGNMDALSAVLEEIARCRVDRIFSLGDNVGYGPEPEKVMQALSCARIPSVLGNHERALLCPDVLARFNPMAQKALSVTRALLSRDSLEQIKAFPRFRVAENARFVHALPPDRTDRYIHRESMADLGRIMADLAQPLTFVGHTHKPCVYAGDSLATPAKKIVKSRVFLAMGRRYIINSGSVGQPRTGSSDACFTLWDPVPGRVEFKTVPYDPGRTADLIRRCGIPGVYAALLAPTPE